MKHVSTLSTQLSGLFNDVFFVAALGVCLDCSQRILAKSTSTTLNTIETSDRMMEKGYDPNDSEEIYENEWRSKFKEWKPKDIEMKFKEHRIIPDVIDEPPINVSKILFPHNDSPEFGNELQLKTQTHIDWAQWPGSMNDTYTLIYVTPDMPTRENAPQKEYQIWIVGNIEGPIYIQNQTLTEYIQPKMDNITGSRRYVFLVFKQPNGLIKFNEPFLDDKTQNDPRRFNFSTKTFVSKYGLGSPDAGNFFLGT